ncbi:response regulator transcription factor [Salinisphaera orenii]|uniref:XRE family transcriptional regulator n=1 Tax=Salinisphaera orenii YIM 95161 TaxID=1051139 RepID=A0A423PMA5_9GAMM|nr:response regulator transcription factor [Salinisphaera halophila]ROO26755.1 XRE family transcriptional regulator [Salinisphaera halophila YIM 95161]
MHVLIVEDNDALAVRIGAYLEQAGDEPDFAYDGRLGLRLCEINQYDAIVLNARLSRARRVDFYRDLHARLDDPVPILQLGHGNADAHRASDEGFAAGADECLDAPFSLRELRRSLQTLVYRRRALSREVVAGPLRMDVDHRMVHCGSRAVELSPIGFRILEMLARAYPRKVTRDEIEHRVWQDDPPRSDAALRGHIHRLRQTLQSIVDGPTIQTVQVAGYKLSMGREDDP